MSGTFIYLPPAGSGNSEYWGDAVDTYADLPAAGDAVGQAVMVIDTVAIYMWDGAVWQVVVDGAADVQGPASAVDSQFTLFNGATGKIIKAATGTGYAKGTAGVASFQAVPIPVADGGTNSTTALSNNRVMRSSGGAISEAAAITAARALISDANGIPTHATTTATEIGYVNLVTSPIQAQIDAKQATITGAATSIVSSNLTADRAVVSDGSGKVAVATTTATEIGYVNGVTSAIQTQINTKVTGPASATDNALARYDSTTGKLVKDSAVTLDNNGGMTFTGTTGFLRLPTLTTAQRDALTALPGMIIFNTTLNRPQIYLDAPDAGWTSFVGWGE